MKQIGLFAAVALLLVLMVAPSFAQQSRMFAVLENSVTPGELFKFESSLKELNNLKSQLDMKSWSGPVIQIKGEPKYLHVFNPMTGFGDLDIMQKELSRKGNEQWDKIIDTMLATKEYEKWWIILERQDLSYLPENARFSIDDAKFVELTYLYYKSGADADADARAWKKLYQKNNIREPYIVHETLMGDERPLLIIANFGLSETDFIENQEKTVQKLGDDYIELVTKSLKSLRKFKVVPGIIRNDLAYQGF